MDSAVPRSRAILIPQEFVSSPKGGEVIFEMQRYSLATKEKIHSDIAFGVVSMAYPQEEENNRPETFNSYVKQCKAVLESDGKNAEYIFICSSGSFLQTRSAVIGAKETLKNAKVFPLMQFDSEKKSPDFWSPISQISVFQAMKCDGVLIDCDDEETLLEIFDEISPYAKIPVAVWADSLETLSDEVKKRVSAVVIKDCLEPSEIKKSALESGFFDCKSADTVKIDDLVAVSNGETWFLDYNVDISEAVICDESFSDSLLEREEQDSFVIKVDIPSEDALDIFETEQYMLKNPVCIYSDDKEVFARAVRMFLGVAIYDGTCDIDEDILADLTLKYGLIVL